MSNRDIAVVLVAAGRGERLGAGIPKALAKIAGETLLTHAVRNVLPLQNLNELIVAVPADRLDEFGAIITDAAAAATSPIKIRVVAGGESRQQSISNALRAVTLEDGVALIHDVARALAPLELFDRVAQMVISTGHGALPVTPVSDTIKRVDSSNTVLETVDRSTLAAAQTPQGFPLNSLRSAYENPVAEFTDDAALFQSVGGEVIAVAGNPLAFKITTPDHLLQAESLYGRTYRSGIGTDTHRFTDDADKPLYLGTIVWPGEPGLEGHSDGDALSHAIVDALLAAIGAGDIGSNFGVDRPEFEGANGSVFLSATRDRLISDGWRIENISAQIIGNRPKVAPNREAVQFALTALIGAPVTVGATTTDGLGYLGQSEGVAVVATALVSRLGDRLTP